ncbi:homocysteine S-methyltransferase family protein [Ruegeria sp. 2205SS24-7]|uniref:homocysteine S-methyltransferase family protein n=1 Tax=Ruegeria discodermiae TaxID=3064389 RepID=UPI00274279A5|nr:homocysteine S-methyltransferase family protein [Ruegeria sp. 2205SS24-7]MDP5220901.1 homocysteine S-methyltransferase family protein [Ruegeria sp. 2205SS24-7]
MKDRTTILPQLGGDIFVTDGGIETTLIFDYGIDLPLFAAFPLLGTEDGRAALERYYRTHADVAAAHGRGFIFESATWRASPDWAHKLGFNERELAEFNRQSISLMDALRRDFPGPESVLSGCVGPRGDGYDPGEIMTVSEAEAYHGFQIEAFAGTNADLVTAITITNTPEAIGIVRAARKWNMPVVISFTLETDGRLPTGQTLGSAIEEVDERTGGGPAYFMLNCAHPDHFRETLQNGGAWRNRICGIRANASRLSHAELDEAETLDDGDPVETGRDYAELREFMPHLVVFGGCCGTDHRHIEQVCMATRSA